MSSLQGLQSKMQLITSYMQHDDRLALMLEVRACTHTHTHTNTQHAHMHKHSHTHSHTRSHTHITSLSHTHIHANTHTVAYTFTNIPLTHLPLTHTECVASVRYQRPPSPPALPSTQPGHSAGLVLCCAAPRDESMRG